MLLAVDQGTSSTKAILVDLSGAIVARGAAPVGLSTPRHGWVEQSAEEIWASVQAAVAQCLGGHDPGAVVGLGLSTQRESLVLWERDGGAPLGPLLSWQDQRTAQACEALRASGAGELVAAVSGLPLDPMFSALKARWLLDHYDPDRTRSRRGELCLGTVDSWLLSRFGGEHVIEVGQRLTDAAARCPKLALGPAAFGAVRCPGGGPAPRRAVERTIPAGAASLRWLTGRTSWACWATRTPPCSRMRAGVRVASRRHMARAPRS